MPRNGSGTYTLPAGNPVVTGTTISSTVQNNTTSDIATALTQSIAADGQTTPTANLPMGGFRHTGVGNASARTTYASAADVQDGTIVYLTATAGTDTITATAALSMLAYATGQRFHFVAAGTNTGAATLNINSIGAKAVTKYGSVALTAGDIPAGAAVTVIYDGTRFQIDSIKVELRTTANTWSATQTMTAALNYAAAVDVASAATTDIGAAASNNVRITGTTTITSLGTASAGITRKVRFAGALTLTHNGTSLILPGSANITTAADDTAEFYSLGSGNWLCLVYKKASGQAIIGGGGVQVFTGNGTFTAKVTGTHVIIIQAGGGSGGGGNAGNFTGSGGGGGGAAGEYSVIQQSLTATTGYAVTVGTGGAAAAATANGNAGNNSVFAGTSTITCLGGSGGSANVTSTGGAGGAPVAGKGGTGGAGGGGAGVSASQLAGGAGGTGGTTNTTGGGGGGGGTSFFGAGGNGGNVTVAGTGAINYGSGGGGGGGQNSNNTGKAGGAGADGIVIVMW